MLPARLAILRAEPYAQPMPALARLTRLWFSFDPHVGRRDYLLSGVLLAALKLVGDSAILWLSTGRLWDAAYYLQPVRTLLTISLADAPALLVPLLAVWTLPFLWVGVSMSVRRAIDAGLSPWMGLLFFAPLVSYFFFAVMCAIPSAPPAEAGRDDVMISRGGWPSAMRAIASGLAIGLVMMLLSVYALETYGLALFFGTPFVIGAVTAFVYNRGALGTLRQTLQLVMLTMGIIAGVVLMVQLEGLLCLLMAAPLGASVAAMGAVLGRRIAEHEPQPALGLWVGLATLPALAVEDARQPTTALREVRSAVEVDAPPMVVWERVLAFPPLEEPSELLFRLGIAYPQRAEIKGTGVGAVRYCVFSTGPFVEPITHWEPGVRLAFDVTAQPDALQEWSPYAHVSAPHLDGYFASRRGEFRLVALPDGRTRLEGSTWYEMQLEPAAYWALIGDVIIAKIHARVLEHVRDVAEADVRAGGA
jgi:uncharacterized membrane protein YhaH (DUF805 family)